MYAYVEILHNGYLLISLMDSVVKPIILEIYNVMSNILNFCTLTLDSDSWNKPYAIDQNNVIHFFYVHITYPVQYSMRKMYITFYGVFIFYLSYITEQDSSLK